MISPTEQAPWAFFARKLPRKSVRVVQRLPERLDPPDLPPLRPAPPFCARVAALAPEERPAEDRLPPRDLPPLRPAALFWARLPPRAPDLEPEDFAPEREPPLAPERDP